MDHDFDACRHPDYVRFSERWQMAWAFWRGGIHVLQPDYPATAALVVNERDDAPEGGVAPEGAPRRTKYQWTTVPYASFLFKHARETIYEYEDRHRRASNLPLFQYALNTLAAGTLRDWPVRDSLGGFWEDYHSDMDLVGTDVDAFMRRALSLGLVFGRMHAVTDMANPEQRAVSKLQQQERGERPYSYLVSPLDLVDWSVDSFGRFEWAVLIEPAPQDRRPGVKPDIKQLSPTVQYRVLTKDGWEVWRRAGRERMFESVDRGTHGLGRVPISTLYCTRLAQAADMACETPLPDLLDLNRQLFNELSELDETDRAQSFAILGIPQVDGQAGGGIDIGPKRGLMFPAEGGAPAYISSDPQLPAGRWQRLTDKSYLGRQLGGIGRGKSEYSKEERSAAAISVESEDKKNQLAWWSKALQEFDQGVHRDAAEWMGERDYPKAAYSTNFDTKGLMVEVQELVQLATVEVVADAREAVAVMAAPIIRKMLREQGVDEDKIEEAMSSLEKSGKKKPEKPPVALPFGQKPPAGDQPEPGDEPDASPA